MLELSKNYPKYVLELSKNYPKYVLELSKYYPKYVLKSSKNHHKIILLLEIIKNTGSFSNREWGLRNCEGFCCRHWAAISRQCILSQTFSGKCDQVCSRFLMFSFDSAIATRSRRISRRSSSFVSQRFFGFHCCLSGSSSFLHVQGWLNHLNYCLCGPVCKHLFLGRSGGTGAFSLGHNGTPEDNGQVGSFDRLLRTIARLKQKWRKDVGRLQWSFSSLVLTLRRWYAVCISASIRCAVWKCTVGMLHTMQHVILLQSAWFDFPQVCDVTHNLPKHGCCAFCATYGGYLAKCAVFISASIRFRNALRKT